METTIMTLSDLEGYVCCLQLFSCHTSRNIACTNCNMFHTNRKAQVASKSISLIESEGILKVTESHVYTVNVVISRKRCQMDLLQIKRYMANPITTIPITLSDF